jgi:hypothetical protein
MAASGGLVDIYTLILGHCPPQKAQRCAVTSM